MKKILFLLITLAFLSCKKDDQTSDTPPPVNNVDPCADVYCQNGGTCDNGICSCPAGYYGNLCENQFPASSLTVTKIVLTSFAPTDNGAGWDLTSAPDIYIATGANCDVSPTSYFPDANSALNYTFQTNWYVSNPNTSLKICIYDHDDLDSDDLMLSASFIPQDFSEDWPEILYLTSNDNQYDMEIHVDWNY